jgi:hypothetical protein
MTDYSKFKIFACLLPINEANMFNDYVKRNSINKSNLLRRLLLDHLKIIDDKARHELDS